MMDQTLNVVALKVLVLAGGPDRERAVSLKSGTAVAAALREAGHEVVESDIGPGDLSALDQFERDGFEVIFPVLHGSWGEGGALQRLLDERRVPYVGCAAASAELCMDKWRTKRVLVQHGLPTPAFEMVRRGEKPKLAPPLVLKAICEGSSIDLVICRDAQQLRRACAELGERHEELLAEKFVAGKEMTVGVIAEGSGHRSLPPIRIIPATEFYDYDAKYVRDDTQYLFEPDAIGLPQRVLDLAGELALKTHNALGCRHMSRVDMIIDDEHRPWILEVNTIPGFTSHSLLPKAAARVGIDMANLVDRLVRLALASGRGLRSPRTATPAAAPLA